MASMRFTAEQQKVIDTRNRNLLVSAAAGSGKTAVLVERIIQMVSDETAPIPVSDLLVVTFTNGAAAEMRERISSALYQKIEAQPENSYLQQQLTLMPSANIMTLHAFCLRVIKNHFYRIDLDPAFSIGNEADLILMRQEVLEEVIEAFYEQGDAAFLALVEGYAAGKTDKALESLVMTIYDMSRSHPQPAQWLEASVGRLHFDSVQAWMDSDYMAFIIREVKEGLAHAKSLCEEALAGIGEEEALLPMAVTIKAYLAFIEDLTDPTVSAQGLFVGLRTMELPRAKPAKRGTDKALVEPIKYLRDEAKEQLKALKATYGKVYDDQFIEEMAQSHKHMAALGQVVMAFSTAFSERKLSKNLLDFGDIEHFALKILLEDDGRASDVAKVYQNQFTEILADEYQDINLVQETLIRSVSREALGEPNIFMVGDIKQSIYKFRLAKPELFAKKYATYTEADSKYQKIELHKNFRSRKEVIETTNYLFAQLMSKEIGEVTYDHHAALHQGARYELEEGPYETELVLVDKQGEKAPNPQVEALQVCREIEGLMTKEPPMMVYDKATDEVRPLMYKDIVILLRTMSGWSETFVSVLKDHSIPVFSNTATGYFDTIEIQTTLNLLKIIDNPKQDIPLLSVLRSPMFRFTGDDLVAVRLAEDKVDFHSALETYRETVFGDSDLDRKVGHFMECLKDWRAMGQDKSIYELLRTVLDMSGYYDYVAMMPGGFQRQRNLDMLMTMVYSYEQSTYKGLFNFLHYMENVKRQSVDYGEASTLEDGKNQVTIMSIHGSKGLEFPVVILGGLSKPFNRMDLRKSVLLHQDYGFGTDRVLVAERQRLGSPTKEVIKTVMERELLSEELRILYVALTRAREKLIFLGTVKDLPGAVEKWAKAVRSKTVALDRATVAGAGSYLDWIMYGLLRHNSAKDLLNHTEAEVPTVFDLGEMAPRLAIREVAYEVPTLSHKEENPAKVIAQTPAIDDAAFEKRMAWVYPYKALEKLHLSQSVSELKRLASEETSAYAGPEREKPAYRPKFITGELPLTGAERGTVFHLAMAHMDFSQPAGAQDIQGLLRALVTAKVMTEKEKATVFVPGIEAFLQSDLGQRVHEAAKLDLVFKEKPFVMGIPTEEVTHMATEDRMMVQGVVDLYFIEDDGVILVDYKTDYAKDVAEEVFIQRYKTQMAYYKRALEQSLGMGVKEIWLYAVGAKKAIEVVV